MLVDHKAPGSNWLSEPHHYPDQGRPKADGSTRILSKKINKETLPNQMATTYSLLNGQEPEWEHTGFYKGEPASNTGRTFLLDEEDTHSKSTQRPKKENDKPSQYASALAHELRNPLTNIKLSVEMLESIISDDQLKMFLAIITRSSARINELINELLKNRPEEIQPEKHSIHHIVDEVLELAKDRLRLKNIEVSKNYSGDCERVLNKPEIKIALTNIIVNAIDAMTAGNGQLKFMTKSVEGKFVLMIQDNGCGISTENLKNIFKPFFTNKPGGLGFGLTATYNLLHSNHVNVNVESRVGEGTCFILLFDKNE
ncbi:MAG TPA: ATP-binding protein [Chitinophagaceae bacterium]|nr:ATP-binding protein [Chitinophagaceae bacterium]